ncbi:MAG: AMP-binding protein [Pseudomonadota bacterium]
MIDIMKGMTLGEMIDQVAGIYSDKEALVFQDLRLSFRDLQEKTNQLARGLLKIGVKKGDKVAIFMGNRAEWVYTRFAVPKIGAVLVPVNIRYKTHELEYILENSDATTLIMADRFSNYDFMKMIQEICPEVAHRERGKLNAKKMPFLKNVVVFGERRYNETFSFSDVMDMGADRSLDEELKKAQASTKPEDIVDIQYTSGTTGFPKGVMLDHHMVDHMFLAGERGGCTSTDRMIIFLPLFHVFGNASALVLGLSLGACIVLQESFDPEESLKLMVEEKCTYLNCVPANIIMFLNHPAFLKYRDKLVLKKGIIGGAPSPVQLILDMAEKMGIFDINSAYGQTECCGITAYSVAGDNYGTIATTVGKPTTDYDVKIVDTHTGETLPPGREGELLVRGKAVMKGYYKMPKETAKALDKDGWCRSGDLFIMDEERNMKITGRVKDIYISGGENVAPAEVENFLFKHPKVKQVQIVGVPDQKWGEVGAAFVELKQGETAAEEEIINFCKGKIATYKIPKYVRVVKEFPVTASGKIQKFKLKEAFLQEK